MLGQTPKHNNSTVTNKILDISFTLLTSMSNKTMDRLQNTQWIFYQTIFWSQVILD